MRGNVEIVKYQEHGAQSVTVTLALNGKLAVPFTCGKPTFWGFELEAERMEWLKRTAQTMLDIYGDSRDGRTLSDQEVLMRTSA